MGHERSLDPTSSLAQPSREEGSSPEAPHSPGARVFEITFPLRLADRYVAESEIGRGGMGRVLLGRDEKLRRRVAIKMLVRENGGASDVRRLEREAQILGALNHPNIVAVHDIGLWGDTPFIVSELVDGKTLRELVSQGPLPWQEALRIGAQIARALEGAHERGIVHSDLKPENVLLRADGVVKVVDFGLAHSGGQPEAAEPGIETPITMSSETAEGTVGYMSPEQAKQRPADARSDIFSLAVVLQELMSGRRPFRGSTPMQVGYATAFKPPEPLPESVPEDVRALLARCLEKDPERRPQTAHELAVRFDERLARESLPPAPRSRALALGAVALLLAISAGALSLSRRQTPPAFKQVTFHSGAVWSARFAPDGKTFFYTEGWDEKSTRVYSATLDNPREARLEADDASILAVSPKGELAMLRHPQIVCYGYRGKLDALSSGGAPVENAGDADFAPDGSCRAVIRGADTRDRLEFPEGHVLYETAGWLSQARVSPDGRRVAFYDHPLLGEDAGRLLEVDGAGKVTVLAAELTSGLGLAWGPSGDEVWFTAAKKTDAHAARSVREGQPRPAGHQRQPQAGGRLAQRRRPPDPAAALPRDHLHRR
jgi:serine/threonine protein kinase